jgi:uncharacterized protein (DUF1330 family)
MKAGTAFCRYWSTFASSTFDFDQCPQGSFPLLLPQTPGKLIRGKAMNQSLTLAIGMLVGTPIGAAAVNELHAQGKAPGAYAILDISEILDPATVPQIVAKAVSATKAAGGQYLAATEKITALTGDPPKRVAIVAFDSVDQAKAWYSSPAQQEVNAMDDKAVKHRWYIVDSEIRDRQPR